jgi:hypothetical protein
MHVLAICCFCSGLISWVKGCLVWYVYCIEGKYRVGDMIKSSYNTHHKTEKGWMTISCYRLPISTCISIVLCTVVEHWRCRPVETRRIPGHDKTAGWLRQTKVNSACLYLQLVASEREESQVIIVSRICRQTNRMTWEITRAFDSIMADYRYNSRENYSIGVLSCAFVDVIGFPVVSFNSFSFSSLNYLKGKREDWRL